MRRAAAPALALLAGCNASSGVGFEVDGGVIVTAAPRGTVVALWDVRSTNPAYFYKYGEGTRDGSKFTLTWEEDPPTAALNAGDYGVAIFALLPEGATVPDGKVAIENLSLQGISADTGVVFRLATSTGPAWSTALPTRFSCTSCVRSQLGNGDRYDLTPCAAVTIQGPGAPLCDW